MNRIGNLFFLFALGTLVVYTQSLALGRLKINVASQESSEITPEPCPANEEYNACIEYCKEDCSGKVCLETTDCYAGCQCISGYVRNNGTCILKSQCNEESSTTPGPCPANEEYHVCIDCEELTCADHYSEEICLDNDDCDPGCQCVSGYVRNNGTCILRSQCS
ncbi:trypsin inhibitor like cysteine rich domain-containing protein [Ditylenchus destructor]|uniref:Trypsin inhibitor like cysteine rich domain-containing protein n=1 Tax=Ditylenchus destructor TaxID=166010 RepID=A0AAD4MV61_9BILA|nr:trypsin inhibitor like cysteine rich domain-containing protein [Ditylenchus destructor]